MIALVDCDCFYVSCERLFDPALRGKPVIVLSNNDGSAIARSNEAKALGIKMGQPVFQIKDLVHRYGVIVKSSNYTLYGDISRRVMELVSSSVPESSVYSIDEIFADLTGWPLPDRTSWARALKDRIYRETGIPVGIGISHTKTLAKLANRLAKKSTKAAGVLTLDRQDWIDLALERTEAADVWGIGRRYANKLSELGIHNARQLRDMPDRSARDLMAVGGLKTVRELRGNRCFPLDDCPAHKQAVCVSRSLASEITCPNTLSDLLFCFAGRGCLKLRQAGLVAGRIQIFALSNRFKTDRPQFSRAVEIGLLPYSNDTRRICTTIGQSIDRLWCPGLQIKKVGVMLLDLCRPETASYDLFTPAPVSSSPLMSSIDGLEEKFGRDAVVIGRLPRNRVDWFTKSDNRSPCYTTRWSDIPRFG
jgi:DNA polymerase V|tara:strand:- start:748 stop:2007 length:1260 start_codon:yes stop_codon:yes gene_type:complete